ncbi:MAG TPA: NADH-quinone oxidoreductase subunit C [Stackebrandtia sp.]|jgi:NADH-quinone oxidoreductase subunit C|uniref:NADH-quinone oxidoreductase subunit C n=1 Tax=Stackebrandtia sp. TaxID=2023065 RepID=UPI002D2E3085|nr:NADH-quinone oxidoreductase subunit C [Stackebrandtia sp.]HZE40619.1 NADH-quinone oxidoreductase subunit C [Stackebrandtia sp.]
MWSDEVADALGVEVTMAESRPVADVAPGEWRSAVTAARDRLGCDFFDWLSAVDEGDDGMRIVAHLWSLADKRGLLLRTLATDGLLASIVDVYPGAAWHERETHEMFGLDFPGHPHLAPLLLAPEFSGHPLRKDFVLASRVAKPWPGEKEPGGDHGGPRKRQPMRPPGVPAAGEWGPSEQDGA